MGTVANAILAVINRTPMGFDALQNLLGASKYAMKNAIKELRAHGKIQYNYTDKVYEIKQEIIND